MDEVMFENKVSSLAGLPRDRAEVLIRATLVTLSERLTRGEAGDVAAQLPKPMKEWLISSEPDAQRFGLDEFIRRVSQRAQVPPEEAERAVRAVFSTLRLAVTGGELKDMMSQLPKEFAELVRS